MKKPSGIRKKKNKKTCPACKGKSYGLSGHHILPKRFFPQALGGCGSRNPSVIYLCRDCHDEIELEIPQDEMLRIREYFSIVEKFFAKKKRERGGWHVR